MLFGLSYSTLAAGLGAYLTYTYGMNYVGAITPSNRMLVAAAVGGVMYVMKTGDMVAGALGLSY